MSETAPPRRPSDPIAEGARARAQGRPKDACPYGANTPERIAWMEGYDGAPRDHHPIDRG